MSGQPPSVTVPEAPPWDALDMGWDAMDAEGTASWIYERAQADEANPPDPLRLAKRLGIGVEVAPRRGLWGDATLTLVRGKPVLWTTRGTPVVRLRFAVAHELAEWAHRERQEETIEDLCNATAAAIIAPRRLFLEALGAIGDDLPALARVFRTTESCVALRLGETTAQPVALVSPALVRLRGDEWGWPATDEIRRLARAKAVPAALRIVRLRDDPRRSLLRSA